jgi:GNAT superfamily N-acetyltransferase
MQVQIRQIRLPDDACALAPQIDRSAAEAMAEYRDDPLPPGTGLRFCRESFNAPEAVLLVGESAPGLADLGLCVVGPFADPLTGERVPMLLVLWVHPSVRRRGLAKSMVAEVRDILGERGFVKLAARAAHNDDALISMGERSGFTRQWELMLREEGR